METHNRKIRFNVGGKIFETTVTTLSNAGENSILRTMLGEHWSAQYEELGEHFIDRDPACFKVLLRLLRTGKLLVPPTIPDTLLFSEARYYGLLDQVRAAKSVELDGDNLKLASSITSTTLLKDKALIRASGNGSFSVTNGRVFHVYDWMLQKQFTANLDYMKIVDMEWYDSESIIISGRRDSYPKHIPDGGVVGLFNAETGKLKHKFKLFRDGEDEFSRSRPGILAIDNSQNRIFCVCNDKNINGIGVWDTTTGQQLDFIDRICYSNHGDILKFQYVPGYNFLVTTNATSKCINIFDPRRKNGWIMIQHCLSCPGKLVDMVVIEEMNCVCVVDTDGYFGFVDFRKVLNDWPFKDAVLSSEDYGFHFPGGRVKAITPRSKLRWHRGKLFCSTNSAISVYSRTEFGFELASQVQPTNGEGHVLDFSIGRERIFSLQDNKQHYDINVWETPQPSSTLPPW